MSYVLPWPTTSGALAVATLIPFSVKGMSDRPVCVRSKDVSFRAS